MILANLLVCIHSSVGESTGGISDGMYYGNVGNGKLSSVSLVIGADNEASFNFFLSGETSPIVTPVHQMQDDGHGCLQYSQGKLYDRRQLNSAFRELTLKLGQGAVPGWEDVRVCPGKGPGLVLRMNGITVNLTKRTDDMSVPTGSQHRREAVPVVDSSTVANTAGGKRIPRDFGRAEGPQPKLTDARKTKLGASIPPKGFYQSIGPVLCFMMVSLEIQHDNMLKMYFSVKGGMTVIGPYRTQHSILTGCLEYDYSDISKYRKVAWKYRSMNKDNPTECRVHAVSVKVCWNSHMTLWLEGASYIMQHRAKPIDNDRKRPAPDESIVISAKRKFQLANPTALSTEVKALRPTNRYNNVDPISGFSQVSMYEWQALSVYAFYFWPNPTSDDTRSEPVRIGPCPMVAESAHGLLRFNIAGGSFLTSQFALLSKSLRGMEPINPEQVAVLSTPSSEKKLIIRGVAYRFRCISDGHTASEAPKTLIPVKSPLHQKLAGNTRGSTKASDPPIPRQTGTLVVEGEGSSKELAPLVPPEVSDTLQLSKAASGSQDTYSEQQPAREFHETNEAPDILRDLPDELLDIYDNDSPNNLPNLPDELLNFDAKWLMAP
ncbi:hypothetical protein FOL47_010854 [Perkinsus chesapeaki]|uniref:Uncharacterized protein n=1 Tax=Perkinsus chesapeaki TaxID=330153 RepID=A0A7J6L0T9_PERCH|nr:hypothetical protein FOL47_010854 [Perkinsus chesapeaki]